MSLVEAGSTLVTVAFFAFMTTWMIVTHRLRPGSDEPRWLQVAWIAVGVLMGAGAALAATGWILQLF